MSQIMYKCVYLDKVYQHACQCVCKGGLPEVSVLAVHGHTGTIWTWAAGENRTREGGETKREKGHKKGE